MGRGGSFHTSTDSVDVVGSLHVSLPMAALGIKFPNNRAIVTADGGVATMLLCAMVRPMFNFLMLRFVIPSTWA